MIQLIEKYICKKEGIDIELLHKVNGKGKLPQDREFVEIRQLIMHYAIQNRYTLARAGAYFGQDHATAKNGSNHIKDLCDTDKCFKEKIDEYDKRLLGLYKYSDKEITIKLQMDIPAQVMFMKEILLDLDIELEKLEIKFKNLKDIKSEIDENVNLWKSVLTGLKV
jgi:hypothetical protein